MIEALLLGRFGPCVSSMGAGFVSEVDMPGNLAYLSDFFMFAGCVAVVIVFALLAGLYFRLAGMKKTVRADTVSNLTEIAILFQAMRSVLHDQKTLARDFNKNVEQKAAMIREVLQDVVEAADKLAKAQVRLAQQIDRAEKRMAAIHRGLDIPAAPAGAIKSEETPLFQIIATPDESAPLSSLLEGWTAFDAPPDNTESEDICEAPREAPESPRDPERARAAFRALLNITEESETGNGRRKTEALRARVHEYYDAGMSVAQIAQELGVGKGEVRLMLTLREKRPKPEDGDAG